MVLELKLDQKLYSFSNANKNERLLPRPSAWTKTVLFAIQASVFQTVLVYLGNKI